MGHFEKIVVLIAITCVTVILVVTFTEDGDNTLKLSMGEGTQGAQPSEGAPGPESSPLSKSTEVALRGGKEQPINPRSREDHRGGPTFHQVETPSSRVEVPEFEETVDLTPKREVPAGLLERSKINQEQEKRANKGELLLDDSFSAQGRGTATSKLPAGAALITTEGLRATFDDEIMEYTWQKMDTMTSVAEKFYGSKSMSALLRQFNEDRSAVLAGDTILVPVFDGRGDVVRTEDKPTNLVPRSELSVERGTLYTVAEGDSLWEISKKVYGKGSEWKKILDANTDVLQSVELIQTGMELRIP